MYFIVGIILFVLTVQILTDECITPNKEKAECISLYSCWVLIDALATRDKGVAEFVRQSNCGGTAANPMVCCGPSGNFTTEKIDSNNDSNNNKTQKISLLPTRRFCGYQHSDDYFRTTNVTATITEFPWLAMIEFKPANPKRPAFICGGSLINNRYVLTAAHCFDDRSAGPATVYLGEYHIHNKTDCVQEPPFDQECSDPVAIFGTEKTIPHFRWGGGQTDYVDDIALLRLNRTVFYTDYIRPICLPLPGTTFAKVGDTLISSGWGYRGSGLNAEVFAEIKKKSLSTLIENKPCALAYANFRRIIENQLCTIPAIENSTETECRGDSGGPLVFSYRNQWHQEGIISFAKNCGTTDPIIYTRVVNYLDWILENIEK